MNAIATIMMVSTFIVTVGFLTWRFFTRGEYAPGAARTSAARSST